MLFGSNTTCSPCATHAAGHISRPFRGTEVQSGPGPSCWAPFALQDSPRASVNRQLGQHQRSLLLCSGALCTKVTAVQGHLQAQALSKKDNIAAVGHHTVARVVNMMRGATGCYAKLAKKTKLVPQVQNVTAGHRVLRNNVQSATKTVFTINAVSMLKRSTRG